MYFITYHRAKKYFLLNNILQLKNYKSQDHIDTWRTETWEARSAKRSSSDKIESMIWVQIQNEPNNAGKFVTLHTKPWVRLRVE